MKSMLLSDDAIREYVQLYKDDFGTELTLDEGREIATRLFNLYLTLVNPILEDAITPRDDPEGIRARECSSAPSAMNRTER